jgi:alkanesulfonate monooxygenase SsuD/methylene tetrahydromethanopterin reductase-like flavin-dependent oxidoreductase (luciferase family)
MKIGFKTSPSNVDWATLDETWAAAGEMDVFDSGWMNDHLTDFNQPRHGGTFECFTALAALAHRVPGKTIGHLVLSNTFRQPAVLAKQATTMDHVTGGRFVLGLGAGWHEGEHDQFGIELPAMRERFDRFESAVRVIKALSSPEAFHAPGVTLESPTYPLREATNEPPPLTPGGPPLWLGGQKSRGIRIAARYADGWNYTGSVPHASVDEFVRRRDELLRACDEVGRDSSQITVSVQIRAGENARERGLAAELGRDYARAGCDHLIIVILARVGPDGLGVMASEVAEPVQEAISVGGRTP